MAILIGILLAGYLAFHAWSTRELRRTRELRTWTLGDPPPGLPARSPSSVTPPARGGGSPNARVYSWGQDHEFCVQLFREELAALPETEEPAR
jgi:hypothetical protein